VAQAGVTVNLAQPAFNTGEAAGDVYVSIENVTGSDYDDILTGNSNANILDGRKGFDTVIYYGNAVIVDLANSSMNGGEAKGDKLISIEKVIANNKSDDILLGDKFDNCLVGTGGNDLLNGRGGTDILDGGEGNDTVTYVDAPNGVTANVSQGSVGQGDQLADTFHSIENLIGSNYNDVLIGDAGPNILDGGKGEDKLIGAGGADTLRGGAGNDTLDGGAGNDVLDGGVGSDKFIFAGVLLSKSGSVGVFGIDVVNRFDDGYGDQDVICFDHHVFADFAAVQGAMKQVGESLFIIHDQLSYIEVVGTNLQQLGADDFLFF
jgi:serralysin